MKHLFLTLFAFLFFITGKAQILEPVKWKTSIEKKSNRNYLLIFDGVIEKEWHMYSQFTADGGALPLEVLFINEKAFYKLMGKTKEGKTKTVFNDVFGVNETFFEGKVHLVQEVSLLNPKLKTIEATLNYQVCKQSCINSEKSFTFSIPVETSAEDAAIVDTVKVDSVKAGYLQSLGENYVWLKPDSALILAEQSFNLSKKIKFIIQ